jgi:hypothetical protein
VETDMIDISARMAWIAFVKVTRVDTAEPDAVSAAVFGAQQCVVRSTQDAVQSRAFRCVGNSE